jgi:hypothetical protein
MKYRGFSGQCDDFIATDTEVTVRYHFTPGEPAKLYGAPEDCYEGSPDELEITAIQLGPHNITEFLSDEDIAPLYERVMQKARDDYEDPSY